MCIIEHVVIPILIVPSGSKFLVFLNFKFGGNGLLFLQLETLAGFSAVVDRLGQFQEVMETCVADDTSDNGVPRIQVETELPASASSDHLLKLEQLTLMTPDSGTALIKDLSIEVRQYTML